MRVLKDRGFFYIRKLRKKGNWSLYYEFYKNGLRQKPMLVKKLAYAELGLRTDMTVDEARERCSRLNKERNLEKAKVRSAERVVELRSMDELAFPTAYVEEFQNLLEEENFGSERHLEKMRVMFNFVQQMVPSLKIVPSVYKENSKRIYKYLVSKKVSIDYGNKLIQMLNRWGRFVARKEGSYFEAVDAPRGVARSAIEEAQLTKQGVNSELGVRTKSAPLTPKLLAQSSDKFTNPKHFNWLVISLWFGLRPEEVDSLKNRRSWKVEEVTRDGRKWEVLAVYQTKLTQLSPEQRWKRIPILFVEQEEAFKLIQLQDFARPHSKTVRKNIQDDVTNYGGRKGFTDLMLGRGQALEDISTWLGHQTIEMTWKRYKDKRTVNFKTPRRQLK